MSKNNKLVTLLTEIIRTIDAVGIVPTINALKSRQPLISDNDEQLINLIIAQTCLVFNIPRKELMQGSSADMRVRARGVCFFFIRKKLKLSLPKIGTLFNHLDKSAVSRGIRYVHDLDPNSKPDQQIITKKDKIELLIDKYLESNGRK